MKTHSTNYYDTFIAIADDCPVNSAEIPLIKGDKKTIANMQFELISKHPYQFTSDDILFSVFAERNQLIESEYETERKNFFSKGQACLRTSPLAKRYGWGIHHNSKGQVALIGAETEAYQQLSKDENLRLFKAMRSNK
ncbi:MAG: hypothetical protein EOO90_05540 [Pedobacter sp.]|nr:MAG: hypothetical protein EOO90_05540 [Pedobacter sp.]